MELRPLELRLGNIHIELRTQSRGGFHLGLMKMVFALLDGLLIDRNQLPGLEHLEITLRYLEHEVEPGHVFRRNGRSSFEPALGHETPPPAEIQKELRNGNASHVVIAGFPGLSEIV